MCLVSVPNGASIGQVHFLQLLFFKFFAHLFNTNGAQQLLSAVRSRKQILVLSLNLVKHRIDQVVGALDAVVHLRPIIHT